MTNQNIKVSVLIPTKNGEEYLEECLKAVFNQKAPFEYEVIIIDSGSKDETLEIIKKFQNKSLCHSEGAVATEESRGDTMRSFSAQLADQDDGSGPLFYSDSPLTYPTGEAFFLPFFIFSRRQD